MSQTPTAPEAPKPEEKTLFDKIATAIPIGITALATVFAGMANGELQRAMFWRTAAGQDQARATNQWTFAGLKRSRALDMEVGAAVIQAGAAGKADAYVPPGDAKEAGAWLTGKEPGRPKAPDLGNERIQAVLDAIKAREPEEEILKRAAKVKPAEINAAIDALAKFIADLDDKWDKPVKAAVALVAKTKGETAPAAKAAQFAMQERRYRAESFLEQQLGFLYDARVRVVTAVSDHHRKRSENFFYAMLAGQIGGVVAALALSRKTSTALWTVALLLGLSAVGYGGFVHLAL
ncbi:MAG: hypothetical protein K2W96_08560 [Gemmataceae bacterium]|nr:hypothetical protein [Gemmataceae bacterium]